MRIALQLHTGLHGHAPKGRSVQNCTNVVLGTSLQSGRNTGRIRRAASSTCREVGANRSNTLENSGTTGHLAPRACAAAAAPSRKTRQPLGLTN